MNRSSKSLRKFLGLIVIVLLFSQAFASSIIAANSVNHSNRTSPLPFSADRVRFQQQATFGFSPTLDGQIESIGINQYLENQLNSSPEVPADFPDTEIELQSTLPPLTCNGDNTGIPDVPDVPSTCFRDTFSIYPLQKWLFREALYGNAQLRHRVAWALSQVWVVSAQEIKQTRHMSEYYKVLYKYALGNGDSDKRDYLQLMRAMTLNPAMGEYLDMAYSTNTLRNENYPRELLQLFTTGVHFLNQDGTIQCIQNNPCQPGDTPKPVYNQTTINNFAKVFTGWTFCSAADANGPCPDAKIGAINFINEMKPVDIANRHNSEGKNLLVYPGSGSHFDVIQPGLPPDVELNQALDNIFHHPSVPPFVSKLLIQALVTSDPKPEYVSRVAAKFINNGQNQRGDMREVVKAILTDVEARSPASDPKYGKLREPVQYTTNILRALNVKGSAGPESDGILFKDDSFLKMGQRPFFSPSVFNYYSPKYLLKVNAMDYLAPEFGIMTPTTTIARSNFAKTLIYDGIAPGADIPDGTAVNLSDLVLISYYDFQANNLMDEVDRRFMHGTMPSNIKETIRQAVLDIRRTDNLGRARTAVYLTVTSAEFQIQR